MGWNGFNLLQRAHSSLDFGWKTINGTMPLPSSGWFLLLLHMKEQVRIFLCLYWRNRRGRPISKFTDSSKIRSWRSGIALFLSERRLSFYDSRKVGWVAHEPSPSGFLIIISDFVEVQPVSKCGLAHREIFPTVGDLDRLLPISRLELLHRWR
jgi:hypothetical protein